MTTKTPFYNDTINMTLRKVLRALGDSKEVVAGKLGVTRQTIEKWLNDDRCPPREALLFEQIFEGRVKASDLCPPASIDTKKLLTQKLVA